MQDENTLINLLVSKIKFFGVTLFKMKESVWESDANRYRRVDIYLFKLIPIIKTLESISTFKIYVVKICIWNHSKSSSKEKINFLGIPVWKKQNKVLKHKAKIEIPVVSQEQISSLTNNVKETFLELEKDIFYLQLNDLLNSTNIPLLNESTKYSIACIPLRPNLECVFPDAKMYDLSLSECPPQIDVFLYWGYQYHHDRKPFVTEMYHRKTPTYICEHGFLYSIFTFLSNEEKEFDTGSLSFLLDTVPYFDSTKASRLENMLNDPSLVIDDFSISRAQKCINMIIKNHLTKYNHQPIYTPNIGRKNVPKVLVIDQAYGDMSISQGGATEETFNLMLKSAIEENPDADIIIKTHPETVNGARSGYYSNLESTGNVHIITSPINPISLINYAEKVYVCTSQFGFEALMCNKEVHVFGIPFYAGWGLTKDRQNCSRRTHKRSLEELFFITYILYSIYIDPEKKYRCEIETAINYIIDLRNRYFQKHNITFER